MSWTAEVQVINQHLQFGAETTPGTGVAAGKLLECFDMMPGINGDVLFYTPTGRKYPSEQEENTEWLDWTFGGNMDYNGILYPMSSVYGQSSAAMHGSSSTAKDWVFTPPVTGSVQPQTYSIEQGDAIRAHKSYYNLFTEYGYTLTRKAVSNTGKLISQPLQDGITLTTNPTAVALAPVVGKQWEVFLDTTSGALGTTQLTRVLSFVYLFTNVYGPLWVLNRANVGFTAHVDLKPATTVKMLVEADSNGMALLSDLQAGTTLFLRAIAQGNQIASDGPGAVYNTITHDMAVKVGKPQPFKDEQGVFAIEWELDIVEDSGWGKAQTCTVTNLITAL